MATLMLEDLNLVTLNALLQRLPRETLVVDVMNLVGGREIFSEEQAEQVIFELSATAGVPMRTSEEIRYQFSRLRNSLPKGWNKVISIPLAQLGGTFVYGTVLVVDYKEIQTDDYKGAVRIETSLSIRNPEIGSAFWPKVSDIDEADTKARSILLEYIKSIISQKMISLQNVGHGVVVSEFDHFCSAKPKSVQRPIDSEVALAPTPRLSQLEEIYRVLGELHKRLLPGHDRNFKIPMHQVDDQKVNRWLVGNVCYAKRIMVRITQPDVGEAFWPSINLLNALTEEQFSEVLNRIRDWVFTEYQALGLKD